VTYETSNPQLDGTQRTIELKASTAGGASGTKSTTYLAPGVLTPLTSSFESDPQPGQTAQASVEVGSESQPADDLFRATFTVGYDAGNLDVVNDEPGSFFGNDVEYRSSTDESEGTIDVGIRSGSGDGNSLQNALAKRTLNGKSQEQGTLVSLEFSVASDAPSGKDYELSLSNVDLIDSEGNPIAVDTEPAPSCPSELQIGDFDADQGGNPDTGEFVDITNSSTSDQAAVDGCALVFFDGANSSSYFATDLAGVLSAEESYRVGNPGAPNADQTFANGTLQDGPDALALYKAPAADFPNGTPAGDNLDRRQSAVVYVSDENIFGCFNASVPGCQGKSTSGNKSTSGDPPLLRLDEMMESLEEQTPDEFALEQNYPNPFSEQTTLRYGLPEQLDVELMVYDLLGRRVRQLETGTKQAGWHQVTFEADDLAAGTYFLRLTAGERTTTRKIQLMR